MKKWILLLALSYLLPLTAANISNSNTYESIFNTDESEITVASKVVKNELIFYSNLTIDSICFLDCDGKVIYTKKVKGNKVDVGDFNEGYYLACFYNDAALKLGQVLIKKIKSNTNYNM